MDREKVFEIANSLRNQGKRVTNKAVLDLLGKGSKRDVVLFLREWRNIYNYSSDEPETITIQLSADMQNRFTALHNAIVQEVEERYKQQISDLTQEANYADAEFGRITTELEELKESLDAEKNAHAETRGAFQKLEMDSQALREKLKIEETRRKELEVQEENARNALAEKEQADNKIEKLNAENTDINIRLTEALKWEIKYNEEHSARLQAEAKSVRLDEIMTQLNESQKNQAFLQKSLEIAQEQVSTEQALSSEIKSLIVKVESLSRELTLAQSVAKHANEAAKEAKEREKQTKELLAEMKKAKDEAEKIATEMKIAKENAEKRAEKAENILRYKNETTISDVKN